MVKDLGATLDTTLSAANNTLETINSVDVDGINTSISDINKSTEVAVETVGNLNATAATTAEQIQNVDFSVLNDVIQSLRATSEELSAAVQRILGSYSN